MTTGAVNDIERSTELARKMVCEFGMSKLGPMTFGKKEEQIFLGREIAQHRDFSDDTAKQIDAEVRSFVDNAYKSAYTILESNQDIMHRMASALLERETLDANEIKLIIEGKELASRPSPVSTQARAKPRRVLKPEAGPQARLRPGPTSPA
jgi:cell division protease FtsH